MKEISLNPDDSLNILSENKTYAMTIKSPAYERGSCYLNVFDKIHDVHYFSDFEIDSSNEIKFPEPTFTFCWDKYLQYSVYKALKLGMSSYDISVWEFDSLQEFIDWYKSNQKVFKHID